MNVFVFIIRYLSDSLLFLQPRLSSYFTLSYSVRARFIFKMENCFLLRFTGDISLFHVLSHIFLIRICLYELVFPFVLWFWSPSEVKCVFQLPDLVLCSQTQRWGWCRFHFSKTSIAKVLCLSFTEDEADPFFFNGQIEPNLKRF